MAKEIRKELNQARRLYKAGKRQEAFEIYDRHFNENPEEMDSWDKIRYCWSIYHLHIRDSSDEDELVQYCEMVTDIVEQQDINESPVCVYTQCIFKLLAFFKRNQDWDYILYWLDKIDPELLNDVKGSSKDRIYPSKKEEYYNLKSKALLECGEFEECIEVSKEALETFSQFALNGDTWHKFRIAKSLRELEEYNQALAYLDDVLKVFEYWYVYREFAENYCGLGEHDNALAYAGRAILEEGPINTKVNLYYMAYRLLKDSDHDFAIKHAKLFLAIKLESGAAIPFEIEDLDIDEDRLDKISLEQDIKNRWTELEFENI